MKIKKKVKLNILILLLSVLLLCILFLGIKNEMTLLSKNSNKYQDLNNSVTLDEKIALKSNGDFYNKISLNEDVNILLLGDEITHGNISEDLHYPIDKNISALLNSTYNINSSFRFLENNDFTVLDANNSLDLATDIENLDLAIISFGYNDSKQNIPLDEFAQKYSDLISKIKIKNYNCTIISLLPPNLDENNDYILKMKYICELNNIDYINLNHIFTNSNTAYDELIKNDIPTKKGYDLILQNLIKLLKKYNN